MLVAVASAHIVDVMRAALAAKVEEAAAMADAATIRPAAVGVERASLAAF